MSGNNTFPVITFIGSMKYWDDFLIEAEKLHKEGNIIILPIKDSDEKNISPERRRMYDVMIRSQIDMSDEVHVINKDHYIGESTRTELAYAINKGKTISYMEPHRAKIITLCGSFKFKKEMTDICYKLSLSGVTVLTPLGLTANIPYESLSKKEIDVLDKIHYEKIEMADEVWIIDPNGYVGNDTSREIKYANSLGKKILYYSEIPDEFK